MVIGIDGPAGSGKTSVTKAIEDMKIGIYNIDTGAIYRAITYLVLSKMPGIKKEEILENDDVRKEIISLSKSILNNTNKLDIHKEEIDGKLKDKVILNGEDITEDIRKKDVSSLVSPVSSIPELRENITEYIRSLSKRFDNIIVEGRDICTVIFPDADIKIYMDASIDKRAKRRYEENRKKGMDESLEDIAKSIAERDEMDKNKEVGALKQTEDQIYLDTSDLSLDEVIQKVRDIITGNSY